MVASGVSIMVTMSIHAVSGLLPALRLIYHNHYQFRFEMSSSPRKAIQSFKLKVSSYKNL